MDDEKRKNSSLSEVSFSSYHNTAQEIYVHKLAEPAIQHPHPAIAPSGGIHVPASCSERNKIEEGEISVFGAEKYFNMKLDADGDKQEYSNKHGFKMDNQVDALHQMTPRHCPGTPSASSEASWTSQTFLLRSFMRNRSENRQKKVDGRRFFSNISCTGSCSDGKSVYVNQNVDRGRIHRNEHVQINHRRVNMDRRKLPQAKFPVKDEFDTQSIGKMSMGSNREVYYGPPVLKPGLQNMTVNTHLDDPRKSLEVFGSTAIKKGDITKNLERKLSMLSWDAIPNAPTISSLSRGDDIESDASSDLFEIDNISSNGQALFTRQESDRMSSCMTPYAPSETSIEWSVVTASAADCSFVSDYDSEKKSAESIRAGQRPETASSVANGKVLSQKSKTGGILGCKSQKSVMVAETAYRSHVKSKSSPMHLFPKSVNPKTERLLQADIN